MTFPGILRLVQDDGTIIQVNEYLRQHFNYKHNTLGVAVAVLFTYIAIFGCAHGAAAGSEGALWHRVELWCK